jgi:hypothetical protein
VPLMGLGVARGYATGCARTKHEAGRTRAAAAARGTHGVLTGQSLEGTVDPSSIPLQAFRLRRVMRRMRNKHHARLLIRRVTG